MDILTQKTVYLKKYNVLEIGIPNIISGAQHLEHLADIKLNSYWNDDNFLQRDEFFVISSIYLYLMREILRGKSINSWKKKLNLGLMLIGNLNIQTIKSIEILSTGGSYSDVFSLLRTFHSRINLITLFSLNPDLLSYWGENPKSEIFLDGHIKRELEANGLTTMSFLYEFYSELVHGQLEANFDIGFLDDKIFQKKVSVENQIYVASKFFVGYLIHITLESIKLDNNDKLNEDTKIVYETFQELRKWMLLPGRMEHLWFQTAEERHWRKVGKNKFNGGGTFDFGAFTENLRKCHKTKGQKKKLSKKYNLPEKNKNWTL